MSAVGLNIGYSSLQKHTTFTGSLSDLVIESCQPKEGQGFQKFYEEYLNYRQMVMEKKKEE